MPSWCGAVAKCTASHCWREGGTNKLGRASGRQDPNQKSGELPLTYFACLYVPQVAEETAQCVLNTAALFTVIFPFVPSS